jgi:RHS repeat-associated protein
MEQASSAFSTGVPALAAIPQLAGNSRQGFGPVDGTMHWTSGWVISSTALGIKGSLYDGDAGSRSTGKERDSESGNDYFDARYYSSAMGRFMSPDWSAKEDPIPYAKLDDPQSLNLYAYVRNNPLTRVDADGHTDPEKPPIPQIQPAPGGRPKLGEPGGRQLDPNGADCKDLAKKIDNLVTDIANRTDAITKNPLNLPQFAPPGSPLKASIDGHEQIVKDRIDSLGQAATKYENMCGGGPPPSPATSSQAASSSISVPPGTVQTAVKAGIMGAIVATTIHILEVGAAAAAF